MKISSPNEIYAIILGELDNLIHSLKTESTNDEIKKSQEDAQKKLARLHRELKSALESLQLSAEWDVFSIAFYGETNAGKSTLIETLRILLREPTKEKDRVEFKKIKDSIHDIQNQIDQRVVLLDKTTKDYQPRINEIKENLIFLRSEQAYIENQIDKMSGNIHDIQIQILAKRKSSVANFLKAILGQLREQQEHRLFAEKRSIYRLNRISLNVETAKLETLHELIQEEWDAKSKIVESVVKTLETEITQASNRLSEFSDGSIIGDGHSDYTRKVTTYQFECSGQKFALLDLPGIEGKEKLVLDEIKYAVQKAHAVFYVSSKPTPPQTGNTHSEGTLEKIKKHLGQQTEVYSIFNKRVKNHQQLQPGLINDGERESLEELDAIMRHKLGDLYENSIILSAYPAFLSVANCSQNNHEKSQKKFIEKYGSEETLLQASLVKDFCDWITVHLVRNCNRKIKKSNYKKVSTALKETNIEIDAIYKSMHDLEEKLFKTKRATENQLDEAVEILKQQLDLCVYAAVDDFKTLLRKNIYSDIDKKLDNDAFISAFKSRTNEAKTSLSINLTEKLDIPINEFKNDITSTLDKYRRYASKILVTYNNPFQFDLDFTANFIIKNGIGWTRLIIPVIFAILAIWNPGGWILGALSILGAVISIGKEVLIFTSHKHRASQQKKVADDNIESMGDIFLKTALANLKDSHDSLEESVGDIKNELLKSINPIKSMCHVFSSATKKFDLLINTVEENGVN